MKIEIYLTGWKTGLPQDENEKLYSECFQFIVSNLPYGTILETTGFWNGSVERSYKVELFTDDNNLLLYTRYFCKVVNKRFDQDAVLHVVDNVPEFISERVEYKDLIDIRKNLVH